MRKLDHFLMKGAIKIRSELPLLTHEFLIFKDILALVQNN